MVSRIEALEELTEEIRNIEPEIVGDPSGLTYPYADVARLSNFIRFYHPDGTWSDLAAPTFNSKRPTPYRERFIMQYLKKRGPDGGKWFFLSQQAPPPEAPFRCFVAPGGRQCTKKLRTLPDLYMHVMTRHTEESKMYGEVLAALNKKMQAQLDPELVKQLGLGEMPAQEPPVDMPEMFYCRVDGCPRFFDSEQGRKMHESGPMSPHKKKEAG